MARANVTLRNAEAFQVGDVSWRKNQSRMLVDEKSIGYYKGQSEFVVTDLSDESPKQSSGKSENFTEAELKKLTKAELVGLAADGFGLVLEGDLKKDDLIAAVLEAQG